MTVKRLTAPATPEKLPIYQIQGRGALSPYLGKPVETQGVITGVIDKGRNTGFFLQDPAGDGNDSTSDGVFIAVKDTRTKTGSPMYEPGQVVSVSGTVAENEGLTTLETTNRRSVRKAGASLAPDKLPQPVALDLPKTDAAAKNYLESREGMLTSLPNAMVLRSTDPYGRTTVVDEAAHGPQRDFDDKAAGLRLRIGDSLGIHPQLGTGDRLANLSGPLSYYWDEEFRMLPRTYPDIKRSTYPPTKWGDLDGDDRITPTDLSAIKRRVGEKAEGPLDPADMNADGKVSKTDYNLAEKRGARATGEPTFRISNFNAYNFFDTTDNPKTDDDRLSGNQLQQKLAQIAGAIRTQMKAPDLLAMQEVENGDVLKQLVERPELKSLGYKYELMEGVDRRGINVALLYRGDSAKVSNVRQAQKESEISDGLVTPDGQNPLFARPPLVADVAVKKGDRNVDLTMIVNHFKSKFSPDGIPTEPRRLEQARFVAKLVDDLRSAHPEREVVVVGDLNDDENSKVLRTLTGTGKRSRLVSTAKALIPQGERYTYNHDGRSQVLDHVLLSPGLVPQVEDAGVRHFDNDLPTSASWGTGPYGASDHDSPYVDIRLPAAAADAASGARAVTTHRARRSGSRASRA